jgi:hypothetical protein
MKRPGLLSALLISSAFLTFFIALSLAQTASKPKNATKAASSVKLVQNNGIPTEKKSWSSCSALVPEGWMMTGQEQPVGIGVDLTSPDGSAHCTYGILAVPVSLLFGKDWYGTRTPDVFVQTLLEQHGTSAFQFDSEARNVGEYQLRYWRGFYKGRQVRGFAHFKTFNSGIPNTYIIACRIGLTDAERFEEQKNLLYDIAASVRCKKSLMPSPSGRSTDRAKAEPKGSSRDLSVERQEATMGFQNVYSPSTGEHWEASYKDYNATGPDGPGYYRQVGNSYEKLNEGFAPTW